MVKSLVSQVESRRLKLRSIPQGVPPMKKLLPALAALLLVGLAGPCWAQTGPKVLCDSLHAQTAGNADWVLDEDTCGTAQRYPTPASSGITASTPETYWGGAYSAFGVDLVKKNFQVES